MRLVASWSRRNSGTARPRIAEVEISRVPVTNRMMEYVSFKTSFGSAVKNEQIRCSPLTGLAFYTVREPHRCLARLDVPILSEGHGENHPGEARSHDWHD